MVQDADVAADLTARPESRGETAGAQRTRFWGRGFLENLLPFVILAVLWEGIVQIGVFPRLLMPSLGEVATTFVSMVKDGSLFMHVGTSLMRLMVGFVIGSAIGIAIGLLMGQLRWAEKFFLPLLSALMPIPSLAWIPLFVLWFGLGNTATLGVIIFASALPTAFNTWTGVKTVSPVTLRAAESMGCAGPKMFTHVIFPAALPMIFAGLRIGLSQGWRALVAGEMLAATNWGLGYGIFEAREFLATDVMLVLVMTIGLCGFLIVSLLFSFIERRTVVRWGMLKGELGA